MLVLLLSLLTSVLSGAAERGRDPFQGDLRLQRTLIIRVSRMPIAEIFQRIETSLGVRLAAEGEDVADQKLDLFTNGEPVTAAETLTAIAELLNAECPPRGFRWERFGQATRFRYVLVRDIASRRWEAERAAAAETRMPQMLRQRFAELGRTPFGSERAGLLETPTMRRVLPTLTDTQFARLCRERYLELYPADCAPAQKALLQPLLDELLDANMRRSPRDTQERIASRGRLQVNPKTHVDILVRGQPPRYTIEVAVGAGDASRMAQLGLVGYAEDPAILGNRADDAGGSALPVVSGKPIRAFALPPRSSWRMGDVLADIAARAKVNLIADDYTLDWSRIRTHQGVETFTGWLVILRDECGYAASYDGGFLRLRNRAWFMDRQRELPSRLVSRWRRLLHGTGAERMQLLVEIAYHVPFSPHPRIIADRMRILTDNPDLDWTIRQERPRTVRTVIDLVALRQVDLHLYDRLPPAKKQRVVTSGLTIPWSEIPDDLRAWYLRFHSRIREEQFRSGSLFMHFNEEHLQMNWTWPALGSSDKQEVYWNPQPADDPQGLVGQPVPELDIEESPGKSTTLHPRGPVLLYLTPAWPRPLVTEREEFAGVKALEMFGHDRVRVLGTQATAAELREWWKERGLMQPPLALRPATASLLGLRDVPMAIVVDRGGRITWVKVGYVPGDEAECWRQLDQAGG